jgi:hypothetical protein
MIKAFLNGIELPPLEVDFISQNLENAVDITTLDNSIYTDFIANTFNNWTLNWESLTESEYQSIRSIYDSQFTSNTYPSLSIPYYSVENIPVRMYINIKDIWNHCGSVKGVVINLRETNQLQGESS